MSDLIDRQAAINAIENTECELLPEEWDELTDAIKAVPPAPSAQTELAHCLHTACTDAISRQAAIEAVVKYGKRIPTFAIAVKDALENLPSAQERPKGHWVEIGDEPYDEWECDMCGFVIDWSGCIDPEEYKDVYNFCPNCGADMRGDSYEKCMDV